MTEFNETRASDPRIPVGTRVRYTQRGDEAFGRFYEDDTDGPGVVEGDDGSNEAPYTVRLDTPGTALGYPAPTVRADYNELEVLS